MTLYAGETAEVRHRALGYRKEPLTGDDIDVTVTIWDLDGTPLVDEAPMIYDATLVFDDESVGGWFYVWATPDGEPGAYKARCSASGATALGEPVEAVEFQTIRLRRDKSPV